MINFITAMFNFKLLKGPETPLHKKVWFVSSLDLRQFRWKNIFL